MCRAELGALEAEIAEANADIELLTGDVLKDATDTKNEVLSHLSVLLRCEEAHALVCACE